MPSAPRPPPSPRGPRSRPGDAYAAPRYYDLAFSFRDTAREVAFLCDALRRFSGRAPRRVLELACGSAPHLADWQARGCAYVGVDRSAAMLRAARARGLPARLVRADMRTWDPGRLRADIAYVTLGSLYLDSNAQLLALLGRLERALLAGGLFALDGVAWFHPTRDGAQAWTIRRGPVQVRARFHAEVVDPLTQAHRQVLRLDVRDGGRRLSFESAPVTKLFFPQELELAAACQGGFRVMGWYGDFRPGRRAAAAGRQVLVLRRR